MLVVRDDHAQRLERMRPAPLVDAMGDELEGAAGLIVRTAQQSILDGSGGGVRSLPGEAPNNQTGVLHDSGFVADKAQVEDTVTTGAGFSAPYAGYLEGGTSKMEARPFLEPAMEENRLDVFEGLVRTAREVIGLK